MGKEQIFKVLEFLLIRYCRNYNIASEPYNNRKGETFANYIESAIKNDCTITS